MSDSKRVIDLQVESDETVGQAENGFLAIRRVGLRNVYDDGGLSRPYICDFIARPMGLDAVVVALFHRGADGIEVLLRDGLRPALRLGRVNAPIAPVAGQRPGWFFRELVAGVVESHDLGEAGIRQRAAEEALEEAGYVIDPHAVEFLGAGTYPTAGAMPELFHLVCAEIDDPDSQHGLQGDGSPMEESATTMWMGLDAAIAACQSGEIQDMKTEVALGRLRDKLRA